VDRHNFFGCIAEDGGSAKRARLLSDQNEEDIHVSDDILASQKEDICFEELCHEKAFVDDNSMDRGAENESWGVLNGHVLARIFHFLRTDVKSLISSATTCRHWNAAAMYYRSMCRFVDLSSVGLLCTDSVFRGIMVRLTCPFEL
jgi:[histone H3]-lysine4 N-trimethyltransferase ATXR3